MRMLMLSLLLLFMSQASAQTTFEQCSAPTPLIPPTSTALRAQDITGEFNCSCSGTGSCSLTIAGGVMFCTGSCTSSCAITVVIDPRAVIK